MKKLHLPIYIIEWSDVSPYVYAAGRGIRTAAVYVWAKLCLYTPIVLHYLQKWGLLFLRYSWIILRRICRGLLQILAALWSVIVGMFTVSNPRGDDEELEDDDDDDTIVAAESGSGQKERKEPRQRTMFDDED